jgi:hypothetical protein
MSVFFTAVYHGQSGPIAVSDLSWTTPLVNAFLTAGQFLGYPVRDLNGHQQTGMFYSIAITIDVSLGARIAKALCYVYKVEGREFEFTSFLKPVNLGLNLVEYNSFLHNCQQLQKYIFEIIYQFAFKLP